MMQMILPKFEYHEPATLQEACDIIADLKGKACALAGGTDLLVNMKKSVVSPKHILYLGRIKELAGIEKTNGFLSIGAVTKASEIAESPVVNHDFSAIGQAAASLGTPLIRNLATIGGNVVSARPAADLPPSLIAYGAKVVLENLGGSRCIDLEGFFKGPGETTRKPDEILSKVLVPYPPYYSGCGYAKLGKRKTMEISIVNVAAFIAMEGPSGAIREARIALGAVAPFPMRAGRAETALKGERPGEVLFAKAGRVAAEECKPIDDFRGSALYKREMVAEMTKRALAMAFEEAKARELRRWE
jgi:CO/xanthine dehydrogenase FAD-binding subunit